ncbi:MAG TPA: hypothetical protein VEQ63_01485, partial [Bryobacteraceae bacterium]|nr:hypothetical protein [Bryobacteraceae bacterium]
VLGPGAGGGLNPTDATTASLIRRDEPYHGSTRSWRLNLLSERSRLYTLNGRFAYAGTERDFIFDEFASGTNRFGTPQNRQILVFGSGRRPVSAGSLTISLFPAERLTVVNHTSFHSTRMEGDGLYRELAAGSFDFSEVRFNYLGIRTLATATDANFRLADTVTVFAGHQFSTRRIRSIEQTSFDGVPDRLTAEQDSNLHLGRGGVRVQAFRRRLSLLIDGEVGRVDRPVYPTSERNFHVISGRLQYRTRTLSATALVRTNYNVNSASLFAHSSKSRNYSADLSWSPRTWGGLDVSYSKLHLDTVSGIAYFFEGAFTPDTAVYLSNIHSASITGRASVGNRVDLFVGYTRVQDTGGDTPGFLTRTNTPFPPESPLSLSLVVFPLTYDSPMARVSVRVHQKLRFNAGYQFYRYDEERLPSFQAYRAHTGFTSLLWSF